MNEKNELCPKIRERCPNMWYNICNLKMIINEREFICWRIIINQRELI